MSLIGWIHVNITEKVSWEFKVLHWSGKGEFQNIQCSLWFRKSLKKYRDSIKATVKVSRDFCYWCELNTCGRQPAAQKIPSFHKARDKNRTKENLNNMMGLQHIFFLLGYTHDIITSISQWKCISYHKPLWSSSQKPPKFSINSQLNLCFTVSDM